MPKDSTGIRGKLERKTANSGTREHEYTPLASTLRWSLLSIEFVVGRDRVAKLLDDIILAVGGDASVLRADGPEAALLDVNADFISEHWPLGQAIADLRAYAWTPLDTRTISRDDAKDVESKIESLTILTELVPRWIWKSPSVTLSPLIKAARGRLNLETGKMVAPLDLAALMRISDGRMRNLISQGQFNAREGKILNSEAWTWIEQRTREDDDLPMHDGPESPIFVPYAADGSSFLAAEAKFQGGYIIGRDRHEERLVEDYFEALAELQRMSTPIWTMPRPNGEASRVVGIRWVRITRPEIEP